MKRILSLVCLILALLLATGFLSGCSKQVDDQEEDASSQVTEPTPAPKETGPYRIGLVQYEEYAPYDKAREAFISRLEEWGFDDSKVQVDYQNAGGDADKLEKICKQFVDDRDSVVVAISTPAAEAAVKACAGAGTKVVFLGSDEGLEGIGDTVTGVAALSAAQAALNLALEIDPSLKAVGILYDPTCPLDKDYVQAVKDYCAQQEIECIEGPAAESKEVKEKMEALCQQADAVFSPVDSTVAGGAKDAAEAARTAKVPWYASTEDLVEMGAMAGACMDYAEAGNKAADFAVQLIAGKSVAELPVHTYSDGKTYINQQTIEQLGIKVPEEILETANYRQAKE